MILQFKKNRVRWLQFFKRQKDTEWINKLAFDKVGLKQSLIYSQKYVIAYNLDVEAMETLSYLDFQEAGSHEVGCLYDEVQDTHEMSKDLYRSKSTGTPAVSTTPPPIQMVPRTPLISQTWQKYNINTTPDSFSTPTSGTGFTLMTCNDVRTIDFIRYTNFQLTSAQEIMGFYRDLFSQGSQYNIHLHYIKKTNQTKGIMPASLPTNVMLLTGKTLHSKFKKDNVIDRHYKTT